MILYCVICYLIMLGMIIEDERENGKLWKSSWIAFIFAPFLLPIFIGMYIQETSKK